MSTNEFFTQGKLTCLIDGQFGSSGKGKLASYLIENLDQELDFACCAFAPQAGHTVVLDDGRTYFYQQLPSVSYSEKVKRVLIGPAAIIELPVLLKEIEVNNLNPLRLGISPLATILEPMDSAYERGEIGFANPISIGDNEGTMKNGSTAHGVGSAVARKVLRHKSVRLVRDVPELKDFVVDVSAEIIHEMAAHKIGLLEIAQGFPLSLNYRFFPNCTSRNISVSQALSDMFLPPVVAGQVIINLRTYPIRINSNKYLDANGNHLTWKEVQQTDNYVKWEGNSGGWYEDQKEITWEEITQRSGSPIPIMEITSVTKLPRRVAEFSKRNLLEAIFFNMTGHQVSLSLNFMNYIDNNIYGERDPNKLTDICKQWITNNIDTEYAKFLKFIGTGPMTGDMIFLP